MDIARQTGTKSSLSINKPKSYGEIVEYLDSRWSIKREKPTLEYIKQLDKALNYPSQKIKAILVAGSNGKSLTAHFTSKLLREENLNVGAFYSPHILTYNERININDEAISQKTFCDIANEIIALAEQLSLELHAHELLTMMALSFFVQNKTEVAILEVYQGGTFDATNICHAKIATITRIAPENVLDDEQKIAAIIKDTMGIVKEGTWLVSGDQSKSSLQLMQELTETLKGNWAMPIRKLAQLPYPLEQLHGRCAALAERLAQLFLEKFITDHSTVVSDSLLTKPKGQRGRPTTEQKRHLELNPKRTIDQFWKEIHCTLPARFQLLAKEKPSVLLDNASNIDAFKNLLLGVRLLHYQKPLKGLTFIVASAKHALANEEFLKAIRYFFKKTAGQILFCPIENALPGNNEDISWDVETIANDIKSMKVKARACVSFEEAFEIAQKSVDERHGLVVITGSQSIINAYWKYKGIKKF